MNPCKHFKKVKALFEKNGIETSGDINKHLSMGQRVYLSCRPKFNLFAYGNNVYGLISYRPMTDRAQIIVRGKYRGLRDLETGREYTDCLPLPAPNCRGDATTGIEEPAEFAFEMRMQPGQYRFFEVID